MSESEDDSIGQREVAYRLFAAEFEDADLSYSEGEDDRSPNYVIMPTGARVNRLFAVGVLTEVEQVSDDVLRGRVVDPTGAFVTYAGQYQPEVQVFLERVETPTFVAMTGKARTFQPEDSEQVYTSVRPESINEVDAETRDRWTVQATEQTLDRLGHVGAALALDRTGDALERKLLEQGLDEGLAAGIPIALDHYGTTPTYLDALRELALDAARVVAGEKDEVGELDAPPDKPGSVNASELADSSIEHSTPAPSDERTADGTESPDTTTAEPTSQSESPESTGTATQAEASTAVADTAGAEDEGGEPSKDLGDFDPGEFELEDETREQVEAEFGTEFQTGTEVDEPGEADIETPPVDEPADAEQEETEPEPEAVETTASAGEPSTDDKGDQEQPGQEAAEQEQSAGEPGQDASEKPDDLQATVVGLMAELDEGNGASTEALVDEMTDRYGVDPGETETAIQEALMAGECYEPNDGTLKPI